MRRIMGGIGLLGLLSGCPGDDGGTATSGAGASDSTSAAGGDSTSADASTSVATTDGPTSGGEEAWLEIGWGIKGFNAFDGLLPVQFGAQGLYMFSLSPRGRGFYNPPNPSFDNEDMPIVEAWVDIDGYSVTPDGHFNEVMDYPALFYPEVGDAVMEGAAVWLPLPDGIDPEEIDGLNATVHMQLTDRDGLVLTDEHQLVVDSPEPPG